MPPDVREASLLIDDGPGHADCGGIDGKLVFAGVAGRTRPGWR